MNIIPAKIEHASEVAKLFDLYRQFYDCEPDIELAEAYITQRIEHQESQIFVAKDESTLVGFVQLYPTFCSVQATRIFVLYDLYVESTARNKGVGEQLMSEATRYAKNSGASRIDLRTAFSNHAGQHLYEKLGYQRVLEDFHTYSLLL